MMYRMICSEMGFSKVMIAIEGIPDKVLHGECNFQEP